MRPATVLFLAANPVQGQPLQLGEECRAIERKMNGAKFRNKIRLVSQWATRPCDLLEALTDYAPAVLHFSGHGAGQKGLCFQADDGSSASVSPEALAETIRAEGGNIRLAVLNACFSEVQAKHLLAHIPCVIGMPDLIEDKAAIVYAAYVYRALASGKSVAKAHQHGIAALALHRSCESSRDIELPAAPPSATPAFRPTLLSRSDVDAACIYIVHTSKESAVQMCGDQKQQKAVCILTVKATLCEFDEHVIARVRAELRQLSRDVTLEIIDIDEGSVRLSLSLSPEAAIALQEKRADGELPEICGFDVLAFELTERVKQEQTAHGETKRIAIRRLAEERRIVQTITIAATGGATLGGDTEVLATKSGSSDPDSDISQLIAIGDLKEALHRLMQRYGHRVFRYCSVALPDTSQANDLLQRVFVAFHDLSKFHDGMTMRMHLFAIASQYVFDAVDARQQEQALIDGNDASDKPVSQPSPDALLDEAQEREAILVCVRKLGPHTLTAVLLHFLEGFSYEDMAAMCHEKPGTLQVRVKRALGAVRKCIEQRTPGRL